MGARLLFLWDIDHTLIQTGGVGREVFADAFKAVTGQPMREMADPSGLTEPVIFERTLELHGLTDPGSLFPKFAEAQTRFYRSRADEMRQRGRVLLGALEALQGLHQRPDFVSTVLTGNPQLSALAKLQIFGLDPYLRSDCGAFGDDSPDRAALVNVAWRRTEASQGELFGPQNTVIIGDTPNDVAAGQAHGVFVVGVATGKFTEAQLRDAGANAVLPDLTTFPRVRVLIDRGQPT